MNPGLVVKLRPSGPWRIGPDSGARNRVDVIYHSDSLYSAVTSAMSRLGWLEDWLDATARTGAPAVSFSSCFPYLDDIIFVVPPRTVWPPASNATRAAKIRWKSARFVPLTVVQTILAGKRLDENQWSVDGPSDCLVPAGKPGPFRTAVRSNAGVDRLSGASERHSTACIEFRSGSGLWTVVSFLDDAAHERWSAKVKAAFRLLADSGFGGERSRGWGRSEAPEFIDGMLPDLILPLPVAGASATVEPEIAEAAVIAPPPIAAMVVEPEPEAVEPETTVAAEAPEESAPPAEVAEAAAPVEVPSAGESPTSEPPPAEASPEIVPAPETPSVEEAAEAIPESDALGGATGASETPVAEMATPETTAAEVTSESNAPAEAIAASGTPAVETTAGTDVSAEPEANAAPETSAEEPATLEAIPASEPEAPAVETSPAEAAVPVAPAPAEPLTPVHAGAPTHPHWLLSLFTPAAADSVDWRRGNYTVLPRGGRVDSPAGSGELKKQIQMVAEGSVVYAETAPRGSAADVAPDGFAHPVFRAGFAVAIPLPEVR